MAFTFVHAADLHLDSRFAGLGEVDADLAALLREATVRAFANLIDLCLARRVDFLLVAGDVYDGADRSLRAQLAFRDGLRKLGDAGIRAYVVHGNHDPLNGWSSSLEWPDNVHVFRGSEVETVAFAPDGVEVALIHGWSFPYRDVRENWACRFRRADSPAFQVGLLHCNVETNTGHEPYAPCALPDLVAADLDYWALGHVHAGRVLAEGRPTVAYAGNTQGRHVNEPGPRGCLLVRVDDAGRARVEAAPVDVARWAAREIDIGGLESEEALLDRLERGLAEARSEAGGRPTVCRLRVGGRGALHAALRRPGYLDDLSERLRQYGRQLDPPVWVETVAAKTRPPVDLDARRRAEDIVGDCLRLFEEYRQDPARRGGLTSHLADLYHDPRLRPFLSPPDDVDLLGLLDEAETLCLDHLLEEGDE